MNISDSPIWLPKDVESKRFYDFMRTVNKAKNLDLSENILNRML